MKTKKIGIIILAIMFIGGVAGGVGYKIYSQEGKKQELEIQHMQEVKSNNDQAKVKSNNEQPEVNAKKKQVEVNSKNKQAIVKSNNEQAEVSSKKKQVEVNCKNQQTKAKKDELIHSNFESKIQSYVAELRKSGGDISTFKQNLGSINTKDLNTEDEKQLDNLKLAANDWIMLIDNYIYIKEFDDSNIEKAMKCAKDTLNKVNTKNLIATGVMSKSDVDKRISFLQHYVEDTQPELDRENELKKQHSKLKTKQEKEEFYYNLINEAMQGEIKYVDSIKDPKVRQSVESPLGAAVGMETYLELLFPEDSKILMSSLHKVTAFE